MTLMADLYPVTAAAADLNANVLSLAPYMKRVQLIAHSQDAIPLILSVAIPQTKVTLYTHNSAVKCA